MSKDYISDAPISESDEDEFGHFFIADRLCDAILDSRNSGSNVIAVTGKWGAGKSGILEMLERRLNLTPVPEGSGMQFRPSTIRFSPWLVGSRSGLIASFFAKLNEVASDIRNSNLAPMQIDKQRWKKATRSLQRKLAEFGETATSTAAIAAPADPSGLTTFVAAASHATVQTLNSILKRSSSLEKGREDVVEALKSVAALQEGFRIIVLIDDLDRLEPQEAVEVLRLVKAVADFPYVTYVLAYDESILARAAHIGMRVDDGFRYLEKIVQFSIAVPKPNSTALASWAQRMIQHEFQGEADFTSRRTSLILSYWAGRLLETPRDAKRLIISLRMMWPSIKGKADFLDLVWIELIRLKASTGPRDLYGWILEYVEAVSETHDGARPISPSSSAEKLRNILVELGWNPGEDDSSTIDPHYLNLLLPGISLSWFSQTTDLEVFNFQQGRQTDKFIAEKRLGSPRHWRYYTAFEKPINAISELAFDRIFGLAEGEEYDAFELAVHTFLQDNSQLSSTVSDQLLLENLEPNLLGLSDGAVHSWLRYLLRNPKTLLKSSRVSGSSDPWNESFKNAIARITKGLVGRINENSRLDEVQQLLGLGASPWAVANLVHVLRNDRETSLTGAEDELFSDTNWGDLTRLASNFFKEMSVTDFERAVDPWPIERSTDAWRIFGAWRDIGIESDVSKWLSDYLSDDALLCERLLYLITYSFSDEAIPNLSQSHFEGLVDVSELASRLQMKLLLPSPESDKASFLVSILRSN